jgi:hypothetical protein
MKAFSTSEAAKAMGIQAYSLSYLLNTGKVAEPGLRVGGKRIWTKDEVERAILSLSKQGADNQNASCSNSGKEASDE